MTTQRIFFPLYLLAMFFIGLGYLAILPAFEGFDETAHYSSVRQIADTGTIPIYGASFLDEEIAHYQGPIPYTSGTLPFDHGLTYKKFFTLPNLVENYFSSYRQSDFPAYRPSQEQNWQAQHPPLYYILLAPVEKATEHLSFVTQIFILRLVSFLIALAGVAFGLLASRQSEKPIKTDPAIIGFMLYPLVLPMFFPEFTSMGNDCLCLFLVGATAFLLSKWLKDENNKRLSVAIGVVLGLGLLTKAFFIPIIAALGAFLLVRIFSDKHPGTIRSAHWKNLMLIFLPALLIGGGWYAYKFIAFGTLIGSVDAITLANQGGLVAGLKQNFSLYAVIRGLVAVFKSYLWAGTWSLTKLPAILFIPSTALVILGFGAFVLQLKHRPLKDIAWLPVLLFVFFGGSLFYHVFIGVALSGTAQTPGWYLHMPFFIGLLLYAVLFQIMALWAQVALYTGCAIKTDDSFYAFPGHFFCLDQVPVLLDRLSVLGWPVLAAVGFGGGLICVLLLMRVLRGKLVYLS
jgi:hypothetical protein